MTEQLEKFKALVRQYVAVKKSLKKAAKKSSKPDLFASDPKTPEDLNDLLWEIICFPCTELDVLHTKIGVFSHGTELRWILYSEQEAAEGFVWSLDKFRGENRSQAEIDEIALWLQLA